MKSFVICRLFFWRRTIQHWTPAAGWKRDAEHLITRFTVERDNILYFHCWFALRVSVNAEIGIIEQANPPSFTNCNWRSTNFHTESFWPYGGLIAEQSATSTFGSVSYSSKQSDKTTLYFFFCVRIIFVFNMEYIFWFTSIDALYRNFFYASRANEPEPAHISINLCVGSSPNKCIIS